MEITITEEKKTRLKGGKNEEYAINKIIGHPDHRGKIRHHTEDELRAMHKNLSEVLEELDK